MVSLLLALGKFRTLLAFKKYMATGQASEMQDNYCGTTCDQVQFAFEDT